MMQQMKEVSFIVAVPLCIFVFLATIFMTNLLVAQLTHTYHHAHSNMKANFT